MDSSFVNYDGRSVHDMIEALLAMSGDPEAIRRLQESINTVDAKFGPVNTELERLSQYDVTQDTNVSTLSNFGAKNRLKLTGLETETKNGVTCTINADGTVTVNGTATADCYFFIVPNTKDDAWNFDSGYILNGCPEGGSADTYGLAYRIGRDSDDQIVRFDWDYGSGVTLGGFNSSTQRARFMVFVKDGQTVTDLLFKPMVRLAFITDDTYVSYGETNAELSVDTGWITLQSGIQYRKKDGIVYVHVEFPQADIPSGGASGWVGLNIGNQLPVGFRPSIVIRSSMGFRALADNQHKITMGQINTVGGIQYNAHNIGVVDNTTFNSIVADFCYPI